MANGNNINIERLLDGRLDTDKSVYRSKVSHKHKYNWRIIYKYSDILVSSDKDISPDIEKMIKKFYIILESHIRENPSFEKSLSPLESESRCHPVIKKMYEKSSVFNVGPMAAVAGALCDYLASGLKDRCCCLIIENGGDIYIKSNKDVDIGVYSKNKHFADKIYLRIRAEYMPCGLCSSSGSFGHSLSMGKSDLVTVLAGSAISADSAATSVANKINSISDIKEVIEQYKTIKEVKGILVIKDKKMGVWGKIELVNN